MNLNYSEYSDIGGRSVNEDMVQVTSHQDCVIAMVADGLGGHGNGDEGGAESHVEASLDVRVDLPEQKRKLHAKPDMAIAQAPLRAGAPPRARRRRNDRLTRGACPQRRASDARMASRPSASLACGDGRAARLHQAAKRGSSRKRSSNGSNSA